MFHKLSLQEIEIPNIRLKRTNVLSVPDIPGWKEEEVRSGSVSWKGVDPMTLGAHQFPPSGWFDTTGNCWSEDYYATCWKLVSSSIAARWVHGIDSGGTGLGGASEIT